jgi:hypothetical protein
MPQSRRMFRLPPGRIWVRRRRVHIPPSASTTANTPPQTAAPVNAVFRARWSGGATREGPRMGAEVRAGGAGGAVGVSVLTAASTSTKPAPTSGSQPPGG